MRELVAVADAATCLASLALVISVCLGGVALKSRLRRFDGRLFLISAAAPGQGLPTEQFFSALHGLLRAPARRILRGQPAVSLELVGHAREMRAQLWAAREDEALVRGALEASLPGVELRAIDEPTIGDEGRAIAVARGRLARGAFLPIRTSVEGDPLANLFATLARVDSDDELRVQLVISPKASGWQRIAEGQAQSMRDHRRRTVQTAGAGRASAAQADRDRARQIEEKARSLGFDCVLRVVAIARRRPAAVAMVRASAASFRVFAGPNSLVLVPVLLKERFLELYRGRQLPIFGSFVLTIPELAALWHLPRQQNAYGETARAPALAPPRGVELGARIVGVSTWGGSELPVRLSVEDSRCHLHLLGATGTGKTTAMLNLACQDISSGRGVGVLDPKGDLVRNLLPRIPRERLGDVVLISPDDGDVSVGINPLELWPGDDRELVADNALTIFKRIYERYWGPRTDDVLKAALLTLLRRPGSTLADIPLLLTDRAFRRRMLADVRDPFALDGFWSSFERLSEAQRAEAIGPVLNKLRDFLLRARLRRLLCQPRSTVDLRDAIDSGQILLADLSVGRWGETAGALVGSFLVARIWQAVLARSSIPEPKRRDFFLFVDEFQHFMGIAGPFADVLAEARSLRLSLTIANQHLGQLTRDLREAIASNARSRVVFQCGQDDATYLAREFAPLDATALMSLPRFEAVGRISIAGRTSQPFTLRTLAPVAAGDGGLATEAHAASARRFARPVEAIDQELQSGWLHPAARLAAGPSLAVTFDATAVTSQLRSGNAKNTESPAKPTEIDQDYLKRNTGVSAHLEDSREREVLRCLARFPNLTTLHVEDFLFEGRGKPNSRAVTTRRVLERLAGRGLVARSSRMMGGPAGGSARFVYQLTERGYRCLSTDSSLERRRPSVQGAALVEHSLMTAGLAVAFRQAARADPDHAVTEWEPEWQAAERIRWPGVIPDGYLVYASERRSLTAFVEVDLATESPRRFGQKIAEYLSACRNGGWRERLPSWPLVLTVAPTLARSSTLRRATEDVLKLEFDAGVLGVCAFAFGAFEELRRPGGVLADIWQLAGRPGSHPLPLGLGTFEPKASASESSP